MRVLVTPAVYSRVFEILTRLTSGALRINHIVSLIFDDINKKKTKKSKRKKKPRRPRAANMNRQEHNRSLEKYVAWKKSHVNDCSTKQNDSCIRRQITPHMEFTRITPYTKSKILVPQSITDITV